MSHPECNLKIEYKKRLIPQSYGYTPVGANSVRPSKKQIHDYNHCRTEQKNYPITLVGAGAPDVPTPRQPLSPCMACEKNSNIAPSSGLSRAPAPTDIRANSTTAKSLRSVFLYFIGILFFSKSVDNLLLI